MYKQGYFTTIRTLYFCISLQGISMDRLLPVHKFLKKLRGFQREPRICDSPTKAIVPPAFQRP